MLPVTTLIQDIFLNNTVISILFVPSIEQTTSLFPQFLLLVCEACYPQFSKLLYTGVLVKMQLSYARETIS